MESRDVAQKKSRLIKRVALPLAFGLAGLGLFSAGSAQPEPQPKPAAPASAVGVGVGTNVGIVKANPGTTPGASLAAGIRW